MRVLAVIVRTASLRAAGGDSESAASPDGSSAGMVSAGFSSAGGDYVAVNYYPYTRDNGENYYTFTLYRICGNTSCYFALFKVTLHEISEPNPFGLKYAISSVIRLDNADFEFEA